MTFTNRQPLHTVKTAQKKAGVEAMPVKAAPGNVFKAKPMPAFYRKAPVANNTKDADENTPKTDTNTQSVKRDFSRLFKPTAASKSAAVDKVVKQKSAKSPFKSANAHPAKVAV